METQGQELPPSAPLAVKSLNVASVKPLSRLPTKQPISRPAVIANAPTVDNSLRLQFGEHEQPALRGSKRPWTDSADKGGENYSRNPARLNIGRPSLAAVSRRRSAANGVLSKVIRAANQQKGVLRKCASTTAAASSDAASSGTISATSASTSAPVPKKRPAWDLKGRIEDLEAMHRRQQQSAASNEAAHSSEIESLRNELRCSKEAESAVRRQLASAESENVWSKEQISRLKQEVAAAVRETEREQHERTLAELASREALVVVQTRLQQAEQALRAAADTAAELERARREAQLRVIELEKKLREAEAGRRRLHNTVMELKGNIRVFCRVRPRLDADPPGTDIASFPDSSDLKKVVELRKPASVSLLDESVTARPGTSTLRFSFDRVFPPAATQAEVFEEVAQLVQSALDGFNVCIFAYGPTGSGKTHTMEGSTSDDVSTDSGLPKNAGVIQRAIRQLFGTAEELAMQGWQHKFEASFLEIYNEKIQDLLGSGRDDVRHEIKMAGNAANEVTVTNLTSVTVDCPAQIARLLAKAAQNRAVAATRCNEHSSRSHSVFMLKITGTNDATGETCQGLLNLIDLAGSERLKESGSEGARLLETKAINKSLSCLGNVIMAIGNKDPHVPYRDSKLTHLLQPSLGGNSKCLMFLNVSQREEAFNETLTSLRFAVKVNQCNIGTAQKKTK